MKTLEEVLEEVTPRPDLDFVAEMERRMQEGFPPRRRHFPRIALPDLRPRAIAAVAASAMLALLVGVALLGREDEPAELDRPLALQAEQTAGRGSAAAGADTMFQQSSSASAPNIAPSPPIPPPIDQVAPGERQRRVERSAQLTLASDPNEFDRLADSIFRTADRRNGFVLRSSFTQGEAGPSSGFFELRVPASELQQTLNELSRLATVRARSESGNDVTAPFVSLRDRLRTAQAERKSLLRRLELAETDRAAAAIRRLEIVGRKITSLRTQFVAARERTEFAAVFVELVDEDAGAPSGGTDEAVDDALGYLEDILNFLIRATAIILPIALAGLLVWVFAAVARRRARDRALA